MDLFFPPSPLLCFSFARISLWYISYSGFFVLLKQGIFTATSKPELVVVFLQPKVRPLFRAFVFSVLTHPIYLFCNFCIICCGNCTNFEHSQASSAQLARLAAYEPLKVCFYNSLVCLISWCLLPLSAPKAAFSNAAASVAATNVDVQAGEVFSAIDAAAAIVNGRVFRGTAASIPDLVELSSNGVTDLVIVSVDAVADVAARVVADVSAAATQAAGEEFVAVFTSEASAEVQTNWAEPIKPVWSKRYVLANDSAPVAAPVNVSAPAASEDNSATFGDYFPAWFWEGFIFGILFVWIALCGTCVIMDMQTPDRFLAQDNKKKSE